MVRKFFLISRLGKMLMVVVGTCGPTWHPPPSPSPPTSHTQPWTSPTTPAPTHCQQPYQNQYKAELPKFSGSTISAGGVRLCLVPRCHLWSVSGQQTRCNRDLKPQLFQKYFINALKKIFDKWMADGDDRRRDIGIIRHTNRCGSDHYIINICHYDPPIPHR